MSPRPLTKRRDDEILTSHAVRSSRSRSLPPNTQEEAQQAILRVHRRGGGHRSCPQEAACLSDHEGLPGAVKEWRRGRGTSAWLRMLLWSHCTRPQPSGQVASRRRQRVEVHHVLRGRKGTSPILLSSPHESMCADNSQRAGSSLDAKRDSEERDSRSGRNSRSRKSAARKEVAEEPWIQCDRCQAWVPTSQDGITDLSLYDDSNPNHLDYFCPKCREKSSQEDSRGARNRRRNRH